MRRKTKRRRRRPGPSSDNGRAEVRQTTAGNTFFGRAMRRVGPRASAVRRDSPPPRTFRLPSPARAETTAGNPQPDRHRGPAGAVPRVRGDRPAAGLAAAGGAARAHARGRVRDRPIGRPGRPVAAHGRRGGPLPAGVRDTGIRLARPAHPGRQPRRQPRPRRLAGRGRPVVARHRPHRLAPAVRPAVADGPHVPDVLCLLPRPPRPGRLRLEALRPRLRRYVFVVVLSFFVSYVGYFIVPAKGPRMALCRRIRSSSRSRRFPARSRTG